MEQKDLV